MRCTKNANVYLGNCIYWVLSVTHSCKATPDKTEKKSNPEPEMTGVHVKAHDTPTHTYRIHHIFKPFAIPRLKISAFTKKDRKEKHIQGESTPCNVTVTLTWLLHL